MTTADKVADGTTVVGRALAALAELLQERDRCPRRSLMMLARYSQVSWLKMILRTATPNPLREGAGRGLGSCRSSSCEPSDVELWIAGVVDRADRG